MRGLPIRFAFFLLPLLVSGALHAGSLEFVKSYEKGLSAADEHGRPIVLYFMEPGSKECKELEREALRDPAVVAAAKGLIVVRIDCSKKSAAALVKKYRVKKRPTLVLCDPVGKRIRKLNDLRPKALVAAFDSTRDEFSRTRNWMDSLKTALAQGRQKHKLVLVFVTDGRKGSIATEQAFLHGSLNEILDEFVLCRHPFDKECELCEQMKVRTRPAILFLDPRERKPVTHAFESVAGKQSPRKLARELERALEKWSATRTTSSKR